MKEAKNGEKTTTTRNARAATEGAKRGETKTVRKTSELNPVTTPPMTGTYMQTGPTSRIVAGFGIPNRVVEEHFASIQKPFSAMDFAGVAPTGRTAAEIDAEIAEGRGEKPDAG